MIAFRYARSQGADVVSTSFWFASWLMVMALSRLTLPPIDPRIEVERRPLEMVAMLALALPIAATLPLSVNGAPWLWRVSPRRLSLIDAIWLTALVGGHLASTAALARVSPGVEWHRLAAVDALLLTVGIVVTRFLGVGPGGLLVAGLLAVASFPGLVPWNFNVIYNLDLTRHVEVGAIVAVPLLLLAVAGRVGVVHESDGILD